MCASSKGLKNKWKVHRKFHWNRNGYIQYKHTYSHIENKRRVRVFNLFFCGSLRWKLHRERKHCLFYDFGKIINEKEIKQQQQLQATITSIHIKTLGKKRNEKLSKQQQQQRQRQNERKIYINLFIRSEILCACEARSNLLVLRFYRSFVKGKKF